MRLIDADNLDVFFCDTVEECGEMIANEPTVDAVPVVRCRECVYWQSGENEAENWEYCRFHRIDIGPHSFCSYGEKKARCADGT